MGYLKIHNLYKDQTILMFKECYALEKVHGTSTHISWNSDQIGSELSFFSGGVPHLSFIKLFDQEALKEKFKQLGHNKVTIYGEGYGGSCQGMSGTYGKELAFIVFDVKIRNNWLNVPDTDQLATSMGFEVVPWEKTTTDAEILNSIRDRKSEVAIRRDCGNNKAREGVVLRPLIELTNNYGERIITKHKTEEFSERVTHQKIDDPSKLIVLQEANAIANEWCTEMRLSHVLDKLGPVDITRTRDVISAMVNDVIVEAKNEIVESKEVVKAIGQKAAIMFKKRLMKIKP